MAEATAALPPALERALALLEPELREDVGPRVREGYLDLIGDEGFDSTGSGQDLMLTGLVPAIYERWWRPALGRLAKGLLGPSMDDERRIARLLLGLSPGESPSRRRAIRCSSAMPGPISPFATRARAGRHQRS